MSVEEHKHALKRCVSATVVSARQAEIKVNREEINPVYIPAHIVHDSALKISADLKG